MSSSLPTTFAPILKAFQLLVKITGVTVPRCRSFWEIGKHIENKVWDI